MQDAKYLSLQQQNQEAVKAFEARAHAEKEVSTAVTLLQQKTDALAQLAKFQEERKALKAEYILTRDKVSELREAVAQRLQSEAGTKVRIRVQRNADVLEYRQKLLNALYGSKLKNQEDILQSLSAIRPEDLALILREDDFAEFETHTSFGKERGRRILDALRQNLDPLELEVLPIDDRVIIELNVSTGPNPNFKDASELCAARNAQPFCQFYWHVGILRLSSTNPRTILTTTSFMKRWLIQSRDSSPDDR